MSWSYPGWAGIVYRAPVAVKDLSRHGLAAYARHPLLRTVEIDRTYYQPLPAADASRLRRPGPRRLSFPREGPRGLHGVRFPPHARYGRRRGQANPLLLDAAYATAEVVGPAVDGLGDKLGAILFQFPPQDVGGRRRPGLIANACTGS